MNSVSMYDTLLDLPLFRGASRDRITDIIGKTRLHFLKFGTGETISRPTDPCTHIRFILSGTIETQLQTSPSGMVVTQKIGHPDVILADFLFGKRIVYPFLVRALDEVRVLEIDKADFLNILRDDEVFLLNYLNMLSVNVQDSFLRTLATSDGSAVQRIVSTILGLTRATAFDIRIYGNERPLHLCFGLSKEEFLGAMTSLASKGICKLDNQTIYVANRRLMSELQA